jgi:hypothetical protein
MPEKDELDLLLDSALAKYADPGVDSGLEQRVLEALAVERGGGRVAGWWRRLAWAIAVPVAASLLIWVGVEKMRQETSIQNVPAGGSDRAQTVPTSSLANEPQTAQRNATHSSGAKAHRSFAGVSARPKPCPVTEHGSLPSAGTGSTSCPVVGQDISTTTQAAEELPRPKLDVFPTPQPLTPQERALSSMATQAPVPLRKALAEAQTQEDTPVRIAAIHIPPIEPTSQIQP